MTKSFIICRYIVYVTSTWKSFLFFTALSSFSLCFKLGRYLPLFFLVLMVFSCWPKIIYCKYLINTKNNQLSMPNTITLPCSYLNCIALKPDGVMVGSIYVFINDCWVFFFAFLLLQIQILWYGILNFVIRHENIEERVLNY